MFRKVLATTIILLNFVAIGTIFSSAVVSAQGPSAANCVRQSDSMLGFPTWYKYLNPTFSGGECEIDITFPDAIPAILLAVFEILLRVAGLLAVIFVIYGGFQYLTSTGEPEKAKNARTTIINALVGVTIAMFATVIVNLVARNISR